MCIYIISKENQNGESWHQKDNSLDRITQLVTGSTRVWTQAIDCRVHITMSWAELSLMCLAAPKSSYKCSIIYRYDYGVWGWGGVGVGELIWTTQVTPQRDRRKQVHVRHASGWGQCRTVPSTSWFQGTPVLPVKPPALFQWTHSDPSSQQTHKFAWICSKLQRCAAITDV